MKKLYSIFFCFLICLYWNQISAQTINYQNWTPPSGCNIFGTSVNIDGITHKSFAGQPTYNNSENAITLRATDNLQYGGTEYRINYTFRQGYKYNFSLNGAAINGSNTCYATPPLFCPKQFPALFFTPNNWTGGGNTSCAGPQHVNNSFANLSPNGNYLLVEIDNTTSNFSNYNFSSAAMPSAYSYLNIASIIYGQNSYYQYVDVLIRNLTITEGEYGLTPKLASFCGNTTAQTFTINDQSLIGSGFSYNWTIGSGWLYNGSSAPSSLTTNDPTIQLTPASISQTPGNVSVSAIKDSNTVNSFTSTVINATVPTVDGVTFSNGLDGQGYFCTSHTGNQFEPILSDTPANHSFEYRLLDYPNLNVVYTDPTPHGGSPVSVGSSFSPGWYVLEVKVNTACGSSDWTGYEVEFVNCSEFENNEYFRIQASPNPASSDLYVTIDKEKEEVKALKASEKVGFILYDFNKAKAVKQWRYNNDQKQYKLDVAGITSGQYVLVITKGKYRHSTQVIIK